MELKHIQEISENDTTYESAVDSSSIEAATDLSLDQLFAELAKEAKAGSSADQDELTKLRQEIKNLPSIESNLEKDMSATAQKKPYVVNVNDPISVAKKVDKEADAGDKWFNMKKPEITPQIKRDLLILKNRSALDPKRHYKKEKWEIPKYFQTGTIVEGNTEFYSARLARKSRGKTIAEEILRDDDSSAYFKRKYHEIQKHNSSGGKKHYKKIKSKRRGY